MFDRFIIQIYFRQSDKLPQKKTLEHRYRSYIFSWPDDYTKNGKSPNGMQSVQAMVMHFTLLNCWHYLHALERWCYAVPDTSTQETRSIQAEAQPPCRLQLLSTWASQLKTPLPTKALLAKQLKLQSDVVRFCQQQDTAFCRAVIRCQTPGEGESIYMQSALKLLDVDILVQGFDQVH